MKNTIKILFINLLGILFLIFAIEMILTYVHLRPISHKDTTLKDIYVEKFQHYHSPKYISEEEFRKPAYKDTNLEAIILIGSSRTHGYTLPEEECLHTILANATNRTVYNLGIAGSSLKETLYLFKERDKTPIQKNQSVKYVIYDYQIDLKQGIENCKRAVCPRFKQNPNNQTLDLEQNHLFYNSEIYRSLKNIKAKTKSEMETTGIQILYLKEINKEIKKIYGKDTQLVVLDTNEKHDKFLDKFDLGDIKLLKLDEMTNVNLNSPRYHISARDIHPNRKTWEVIVPLLVKKLNL